MVVRLGRGEASPLPWVFPLPSQLRYCLCLGCVKTLPLPRGSTAFAAKTPPFPAAPQAANLRFMPEVSHRLSRAVSLPLVPETVPFPLATVQCISYLFYLAKNDFKDHPVMQRVRKTRDLLCVLQFRPLSADPSRLIGYRGVFSRRRAPRRPSSP